MIIIMFLMVFSGAMLLLDNNVNVTVRDTLFSRNLAVYGGALSLYFNNRGLTISRSELRDNMALSRGGAIQLDSRNMEIHIMNSVIVGNVAALDGGGISILSQNRGMLVFDTKFVNNSALGSGGAVFFQEDNTDMKFVDSSWESNFARANGGAVCVLDGNEDIVITEVVFSDNEADGQGGALYSAASSLIVNASSFEFNNAVDAGAIFLTTTDNPTDQISLLDGIEFHTNHAASLGGALVVHGAWNVEMRNLKFVGNTATEKGGALCLIGYEKNRGIVQTVRNVDISHCEFIGNSVLLEDGSGGAVYAEHVGSSSISLSEFVWNAAGMGGAIDIASSTLTIDSCVLTENIALLQAGGAVKLMTSLVTIEGCLFTANVAYKDGGGAVFWECCLMKEPANLFSMNTYQDNVAVYGNNIGTNSHTIAMQNLISTSSGTSSAVSQTIFYMDVTHYAEPIASLVLNVVDYYGDFVVTDNTSSALTTAVDLGLCKSDTEGSTRSSNPAVLSGETQVVAVKGVFVLDGVYATCYPGGSMQMKITASMTGTTDESIIGLRFRDCGRGEYLRDGQCVVCGNGFYNFHEGGTECLRCPSEATRCYSDVIELKPGYWRLSPYSTEIRACIFDAQAACPGGTSTGKDECGIGYTGILCATCSQNFFHAAISNKCMPCDSDSLSAGDIAVIIIAAVVLLLILGFVVSLGASSSDEPVMAYVIALLDRLGYFSRDLYAASRALRESQIKATINRMLVRLRMTITLLQILSAMLFNLEISFPPVFGRILRISVWSTFNIFPSLGLACYRQVNYVEELVAVTVSPVIISLLIFITYLAITIRLKYKRASVLEHRRLYASCMNVFLLFTFLILPAVTSEIIRTFTCDNVDPNDEVDGTDDWYMVADYSISCHSDLYRFAVKYAMGMFFLYPVGVTFLYYCLLMSVRQKIKTRHDADDHSKIMHLRFLYDNYTPKYWYVQSAEHCSSENDIYLCISGGGRLLKLHAACC